MILIGGASSRMGIDKAAQDWGGRRAVDLVAEAARAVGADPVFTVGGRELGLPHVYEDAPGGPVGGVCAGAGALRAAGVQWALVLATDAPTLRPSDLGRLLAEPGPGAAYAHLHFPMVLDLAAIPVDAQPGWSMARLITAMGLQLVEADPEAVPRLRGANTPAERAALLAAWPDGAGAERST
jgi:molybdopterin-guanine dinucleotide biosynthesis protein A